ANLHTASTPSCIHARDQAKETQPGPRLSYPSYWLAIALPNSARENHGTETRQRPLLPPRGKRARNDLILQRAVAVAAVALVLLLAADIQFHAFRFHCTLKSQFHWGQDFN